MTAGLDAALAPGVSPSTPPPEICITRGVGADVLSWVRPPVGKLSGTAVRVRLERKVGLQLKPLVREAITEVGRAIGAVARLGSSKG